MHEGYMRNSKQTISIGTVPRARRPEFPLEHATSGRCGARDTETNNKARAIEISMKTLQLVLIGAALALPTITRAAINKGVEGSPHDFSTNSEFTVWNTRHGVCSTR